VIRHNSTAAVSDLLRQTLRLVTEVVVVVGSNALPNIAITLIVAAKTPHGYEIVNFMF